MQSDYEKYRGKCKEFAEDLCKKDPSLLLIRGWYICPFWGAQQHWWCETLSGEVIDPAKDQFPSKGLGEYKKFNGLIPCEYCGEEVKEDGVYQIGQHVYCSYECYGHDVGF